MADDKLRHQVSLRLSEYQRKLIREKLEEMRRGHPEPEKLTEADAHRALLEAAAQTEARA